MTTIELHRGVFSSELGAELRSTGGRLDQVETSTVLEAFDRYKMVTFTGFGATPAEFKTFSARFCQSFIPYLGTTHRRGFVGDDPTHAIVPPQWMGLHVPAHSETTYRVNPPKLCWFHCIRPAHACGFTTAYDGEQIFENLTASTREYFLGREIRYTLTYTEQKWQEFFADSNFDSIESTHAGNWTTFALREHEGTRSIDVTFVTSAVPRNRHGNRALINHVLATEMAHKYGFFLHMHVTDADGAKIPDAIIRELLNVTEANSHELRFRPGDFTMIDNSRVMHGARAYLGDREVHVRLSADLLPAFNF